MASQKNTILYVGNQLSAHGYTPTNIETLGPQLGQFYNVVAVSSKKNKILRLLDICQTVWKYRKKAKLLLIDTYSTSAFKFAQAAGYFACKFGIPYIPILHGGDLPKKLKTATPTELRFFEKAHTLVAPSPFLRHQFSEFGFKKVLFIPNNIDLAQYPFKKRETIAPKLLWVRSFHKIYNANMAIEVLHQLLQTHPNACLCMVGPDKDGSLQTAQQLAQTLGVAQQVRFTGKMSRQEWHAVAKEYDIVINTTTVDNTPISVVEAMALGLPVISTNVGGIPYLLTHQKNALLVPSANVQAMVQQVERLVAEPGLAMQLTVEAREMVKSFDWETVQHTWKSLIDAAIAQ